MIRQSFLLAAIAVAFLSGCVSYMHVPTIAGEPEHLVEFQRGRVALNEFTPDGYTRAIDHFERALALQPSSCRYRLELAQTSLLLALEQKLNSEDFNASLARATEAAACEQAETSTALRLEAFSTLDDFAPGRGRDALAKVNRAIQLAPEDPYNWLVRWKIDPSTNRQENSILKVVELAPDLAITQYEFGNYLLLIGEYKKAQEAFERTVAMNPRHFRAYIGMALAMSADDIQTDVEPLYMRAVETGPGFLEGRILFGDYLSGIEENDRAREQYAAAIERNPGYEVAYLRMGISFLQTGEWDAAEGFFAKAIAINPSSYEAFYYTGNIWFGRGDFEKARAHYEESLKFVFNFPDAVYALGTVDYREGNMDRALERFERVIQTTRNHADAFLSRAGIRAQQLQFRDAVDDYNRALGIYDRQLGLLFESIADFEQRGLPRKVESERRKKERVESVMERAKEARNKAEDMMMMKDMEYQR